MSQETDENSSITPIEVEISTFDVSLTNTNFQQKKSSDIEKLSKRKRSYSNTELVIDKLGIETHADSNLNMVAHSIKEDTNCDTPKNIENVKVSTKTQDQLLLSEYKFMICKVCQKAFSKDEQFQKNMRSSSGSHSSNQCESISCMESTVGDSISSFSFVPIFKESMNKATMTMFAEDRQALYPFVDQQSSTPSLIKLFVKKMKVLKNENIKFRKEIEVLHTKVSAFTKERERNAIAIKGLKEKLINTIKFMTINSDPDTKTTSCYYELLLDQNQELENKIKIVESENFLLRKMLSINRENNSFKSFEQEIKQMENEIQNEGNKSKDDNTKSTDHKEETHESHKFKATDLVRKTIRERNKRLGRKRTDSFNFPSFGESSSDEEVTKPVGLQSPATPVKVDFSGYKMKIEDQNEPNSKEPTTQDVQKEDEAKSLDKSSGLAGRRRRVNSEDTSNTLKILSPPSSIRMARKKIVNNDEEETDQMMKGGGYKMCIKIEDEQKEVKKESTEEEQDYYSCFNKNKKISKRDRRTQSMLENEDEKKAEMSETVLKVAPKIKYSIHSIIEEEKSKSSSSTSSVKSTDDLVFLYSKNPNKRK